MFLKQWICFFFLLIFPLMGQSKSQHPCESLIDCDKKADLTSIHRKKITLLTTGINEFGKDETVQSLLPLYLKRSKSTLLEANGETGYTGEIVLKVSHKPEYRIGQFKKAEADLSFIEKNLSFCSPEQMKEYHLLKEMLDNSK
ncbi:Hypothetical protein LBF_4018 [Leptospira biflexa serovar Patoc strain 'Patoc 1 (Ames)']|uniref:Uncharacterized protein n=2 Tax=Leptospira biflexa TaxID=172 RepID=B0STM3_LEPBP|nr:Hypothetical protein LBF_4018 [Leptospira biflexa serovar Patoc strain 'Patoc 1 (Ames)']ABZ99557.1 Hypothetical protein; putative signal peptide [Leptospira biflexa serovar Patoc strain 'Patoc 1 (Paris)']